MDVSLLVLVVVSVIGIILWKKDNDREYLWVSLLVATVFLIGMLARFSELYLPLKESQRVVEFYVFMSLRVVVGVTIVVVMATYVLRKRKKRE